MKENKWAQVWVEYGMGIREKEESKIMPIFLTETKKAGECTELGLGENQQQFCSGKNLKCTYKWKDCTDTEVWVGDINVIVISVKMFMDHPTKDTE